MVVEKVRNRMRFLVQYHYCKNFKRVHLHLVQNILMFKNLSRTEP